MERGEGRRVARVETEDASRPSEGVRKGNVQYVSGSWWSSVIFIREHKDTPGLLQSCELPSHSRK